MTPAHSIRLLVPLTLSLACGDAGSSSSDSLSASGGGSAITSASGTPTTSGGTGSAGESTHDISGGDASQTGSDGTTTSASGTGTATTGGESSGDAHTTTTTDATTATTATTTTDATTGALEPEPCQVETTKINPIPPDILLVLDKSGSMSNEKWDHDENPQTPYVTRWSSLHGVVESVVNNFDETVDFGMKLYPYLDATPYEPEACVVAPGVEVEIAPENAANVLSLLPAANFQVVGGTPTKTGLHEAYVYLQAIDPNQQRFALLITDGEISKTCEGEVFKQALTEVKTAFNLGISTYVVGIDVDGSTSMQLTALAGLGGKPNPNDNKAFYQTTSQVELQASLQQIIDDTLSCVIDVDPEPSEPELFEVWIGPEQVDPVADCAKEDGWVWTKPNSQIELCGQACLDLKKSHQVEARYFCEAH